MLDSYIIDELKRREQAEKQDQERPTLEIPVTEEIEPIEPSSSKEAEVERGVAIIDFSI